MKLLVTGGAGYIGSHTCVELIQSGYDVCVVDSLVNSSEEALRRVSSITGKTVPLYVEDVRNQQALEEIMRKEGVQSVLHFAGLKAVGESVQIPMEYWSANVAGTLSLLNAMREVGCKSIVFSSSATVYGDPSSVPIPETADLSTTNPYGRTKLVVEGMLQDLVDSDPDWSATLLRYFNPVGAHDSGTIGEDPQGIPNNLAPYITQVAIGRREVLSVFGDDYPTPDGTGVRDYIHVVDLALGHVAAVSKMGTTPGCHVFNLGTGKGASVLELVAAFERASGKSIPTQITDRRPGDIATCYADPSKAKNELNWEATRGIERMAEDSWRWQQSNPMGYGDERG